MSDEARPWLPWCGFDRAGPTSWSTAVTGWSRPSRRRCTCPAPQWTDSAAHRGDRWGPAMQP